MLTLCVLNVPSLKTDLVMIAATLCDVSLWRLYFEQYLQVILLFFHTDIFRPTVPFGEIFQSVISVQSNVSRLLLPPSTAPFIDYNYNVILVIVLTTGFTLKFSQSSFPSPICVWDC